MAKKIKHNLFSDKLPDTTRPKGYSFFNDVWDVVRLIPKGRVSTYGAIAEYLSSRISARMVGWAMNAAHSVEPPIPAQRVVNRNGQLTGKIHFGAATRMEELLNADGVLVENDTVVDFKTLFWNPSTELEE